MPYPTATPESQGLDSSRLAKLTKWQEQMVADGKVVVARGGKVVYRQSAGEAKPGVSVSEDSLYRIYSMTKPITTTALMTLYEEGKFQLEDPIHFYLGDRWRKENMQVFKSGTVEDYTTEPCTRSITMRMLMNHTSGLSYGFDATGALNPVDGLYFKHKRGIHSSGLTLEHMVDGLAGMPLFFQPGSHWHYSLGTDVCGRLVEVLSGEPFDVYLQRKILTPLGMHDTKFTVDAQTAPRLVANYNPKFERSRAPASMPPGGMMAMVMDPENRMLVSDMFDGLSDISDKRGQLYTDDDVDHPSGGGGLVSTTHDYTRFCLMLAGGGQLDGVRILSSKTLAYMTQNHLPNGQDMKNMYKQTAYSEVQGAGAGFGLGFSVVDDPVAYGTITSPGTYAWGGAAATVFWLDPKEDLAVVFMTQVMGYPLEPLRPQLERLVYAAFADEQPSEWAKL